MLFAVRNRSDRRRRIGGVWIAPGETRRIEMRVPHPRVVAGWKRVGVRIEPARGDHAPRRARTKGETVDPAPAGGYSPAILVTYADRMDWNAFRTEARRHLGSPMPRSKAGIVEALRSLD